MLTNIIKDIFRRVHIVWLQAKSKRLPELGLEGRTLIVAPHPDDEVLGCGGLMARMVEEGNMPYVIYMTGGGASHKTCCNLSEEEIVKNRRILTRKALGMLGVSEDHIKELDFHDGNISQNNVEELTKLKNIIKELNPENIFIPHWGEGWKDHINTASIIENDIPGTPNIFEYCVWMWYYNIWKGLDWKHAFKVKLNEKEQTLKLKAISEYVEPLAPCGKPWSGVLPEIFKSAHKKGVELFFKYQ